MLYNKNIINEILLSEFLEEIEAEVDYYVMMLDKDKLEQYFDEPVDDIALGETDEVEVLEFELIKENSATKIYGIMKISIFLDGYESMENEILLVDTVKADFEFAFCFLEEKKKYSSFKMEHI